MFSTKQKSVLSKEHIKTSNVFFTAKQSQHGLGNVLVLSLKYCPLSKKIFLPDMQLVKKLRNNTARSGPYLPYLRIEFGKSCRLYFKFQINFGAMKFQLCRTVLK